jgi:hypothetical protein
VVLTSLDRDLSVCDPPLPRGGTDFIRLEDLL